MPRALAGLALRRRAACGCPGARRSSLWMRRWMRRRSISSCVSPGPRRVPMPPACCDRRGALAPQPGQAVAEQGQLDLGLALLAAGVLGEDVEDHRGAVDGGAPEQLLQVALLRRRELVVEHDRVAVASRGRPRAAPRPCPCRCRSAGRARRGAGRRGPPSSAPAVSTSSASSSRPASVSSALSGGMVTPTRTIFSRKERSIRATGTPPSATAFDRARRASRPSPEPDPGDAAGHAHQ